MNIFGARILSIPSTCPVRHCFFRYYRMHGRDICWHPPAKKERDICTCFMEMVFFDCYCLWACSHFGWKRLHSIYTDSAVGGFDKMITCWRSSASCSCLFLDVDSLSTLSDPWIVLYEPNCNNEKKIDIHIVMMYLSGLWFSIYFGVGSSWFRVDCGKSNFRINCLN
jgi:hypothetical protein